MITRATLSTIEQGLPKYRSMLAGNPAFSPGAYNSIASASGSGSSSITFSSIPSTYQHLQLRIASFNTSGPGSAQLKMRFNGDNGSNYYYHLITSNGTTAAYTEGSDTSCILGRQYNNASSSIFTVFVVDIHNYVVSTQNKTVRTFGGYDINGAGEIYLSSSLWLNTSAISSIEVFNPTFNTGSTFSLYGISVA